MKKLLKIVLVSSLTLFCFSCYYDDLTDLPQDNPVVIPPEQIVLFSEDILPIFESYNCTECHNGGSVNPDLRSDKAYNALVPTYVISGNALDSRLYIQLAVNDHRNVDNESLALIKKWIDDGAENN